MKPFDPTKPCQYRNGEPARILCTDSGDELYPIVSITEKGVPITHDAKGLARVVRESEYDLINIPNKKTVEVLVNVYPSGVDTYESEQDAIDDAATSIFARKKITFEVEEGEGL